jgi:Nitrogen regulatory protein PII
MKALYIIINAGFADAVVDAARSAGARGATIYNARGSGAMQKSFLGISVDSEKETILSLVDDETAIRVMEAVRENFGRDNPAANGVCFCVPVEKMTPINKISAAPSGA